MKNICYSCIILSLFLILSCSKESNPTGPSTPLPGTSSKGNVIIKEPSYLDSVSVGTTVSITWRSYTIDSTTPVSIQLYREDTLISTIASYTANDGSYNWLVPSFPTGNKYHIRISSSADTSKWDLGAYFKIVSMYHGSISILEPSSGDTATIGSQLAIDWTITGNIGSYIGIKLYSDSTLVSTIRSSQYTTATSHAYTWTSVQSSLGSGDKYRIVVYSTSDTSIKAYSEYFTIVSQYYGEYSVIAPLSNTTWGAGSSYNVQWSTTGSPGSYVKLELYKGDTLYYNINNYLSNTGSYTWSISPSLLTGTYRIKISSYQDPGIASFSAPFVISGLTPDIYEKDNTRGTASSISTTGVLQNRNLTYSDTDWVSFNADSGKTYLINTTGSTPLYVYLYEGSKTSYSTYIYNSTKYLVYSADTTAVHYLYIRPYSTSGYGDYGLSIIDRDSIALAEFQNPSSGTNLIAGNSTTIAWKRDSILFSGSYVYIYLFADSTMLFRLSSSYIYSTDDSGTYSWTVPLGIASGISYRLKIVDRYDTTIFAYSNKFTITGTERDSFEIDNRYTLAKRIPTTGSIQSRTMTYNDTDWISFSGKKDSLYIINATGPTSLYLYLYGNLPGSYLTYSYNLNPKIVWACTSNAEYKLMLNQYSNSSYGPYSISVKEYSRENTAIFNDPTSYSTWSAGGLYTILWSADTAIFSQNVKLYLYRRDRLIYTISTSTANDGSQSFTLPSGLASGNGYRIRVQNYSYSQVFGNSDSFSIAGIPGDIYEPDDSVTQASVIIAGSGLQKRSLTYLDKDYIRFTVLNNKLYKIETADSLYPSLTIYSENLNSLITSTNTSYTTPNPYLSWIPLANGNYIIQVTGNRVGNYSLSVEDYDSTQYRFHITAPASGDTLRAQTVTQIAWTNSLAIGGTVDIFLYDSNGVVETIATAVTNSGTYNWTPSAIRAGKNDYVVRVISRLHSTIFGLSGVFSIR